MTTTQYWNDLEGVSLAGRYWLKQCLVVSEVDAWYVIRYDPTRDAAVRVVRGDLPFAEAQLNTWRGAMELDHPHIVKMLDAGRTEVEGSPFIFCVCEYPDDFLEAALAERPLSTGEAGEVLRACVSALRYLHSNGLAHAAVTPRQILAIGDRIKLPADSIRRAGAVVAPGELMPSDPPEVLDGRPATPASDMWSLGMTLIEILTRTRPILERGAEAPFLPEPFGSVARNTLVHDPSQRWTIEDVERHLAPPAPAPPPAPVVVAEPERVREPERIREPEPEPRPERASALPTMPEPPRDARRPRPRLGFPMKWIPLAGLAAAAIISAIALRHPSPEVVPAAAPPPSSKPAAPLSPTPRPSAVPAARPPEPQRASASNPAAIWRVIAYQYSKREQAQKRVNSLNEKHPGLRAEVFAPKGSHGPFFVALGGRMTLPEAERLKREARAKGLPRDTFVRNYSN